VEDADSVVDAGRAYVFDGSNGALLHVLEPPVPELSGRFGARVSGADDVNGDLVSDIIVGAITEDVGGFMNAGRAYVFSGSDGVLIHMLESPFPEMNGNFGHSVAGIGDINGDGQADLAVSAPYEDAGAMDAGRAYVFNGATGDTLFRLESPGAEMQGFFGFQIADAGDVNSDGRSDIVVGAYREDGGGVAEAGRAYVFNGANGDLLSTLASAQPEVNGRFGYSVSSGGDFHGDAENDVLVGAYWEDVGLHDDAGRVYVFTGADGDHVGTLESPLPEIDGYFGFSVAGSGDANSGDSVYTIVGAYWENVGGIINAGRAYLFRSPIINSVQIPGSVPATFALLQNYPNPFNPTTSIEYHTAKGGAVSMRIYDVLGREIITLVDDVKLPGSYQVLWDASEQAAGVYLCRMISGEFVETRKLLLVK
jgi:hypothetical protein